MIYILSFTLIITLPLSLFAKTIFPRDPFTPPFVSASLKSNYSESDPNTKAVKNNLSASPKKETPAKPIIHLTGVIWDPTKPLAVVLYGKTKKIIGLNDRFMGYTVTKITRKNIVVYDGKQSFSIQVGEQKNFN